MADSRADSFDMGRPRKAELNLFLHFKCFKVTSLGETDPCVFNSFINALASVLSSGQRKTIRLMMVLMSGFHVSISLNNDSLKLRVYIFIHKKCIFLLFNIHAKTDIAGGFLLKKKLTSLQLSILHPFCRCVCGGAAVSASASGLSGFVTPSSGVVP